MLCASVANVNVFSLVLLVLSLAGTLIPPRIVVLGTLPTFFYVIAVSSLQYFWNIPFGLPSSQALEGTAPPPPQSFLCMPHHTYDCSIASFVHKSVVATGLGLTVYKLPFLTLGLQWALALALAVYWHLFSLYRKWAKAGALKKHAYYSWFIGRPGPGGLIPHLPSMEETAALLAAESSDRTSPSPNQLPLLCTEQRRLSFACTAAPDLNIKLYGSGDAKGDPSASQSSSSSGSDKEETKEADTHEVTGLTSDEEEPAMAEELAEKGKHRTRLSRRRPSVKVTFAESTTTFESVSQEYEEGNDHHNHHHHHRHHRKAFIQEIWKVVKLIGSTLKQSLMALLYLIYRILLHESQK